MLVTNLFFNVVLISAHVGRGNRVVAWGAWGVCGPWEPLGVVGIGGVRGSRG